MQGGATPTTRGSGSTIGGRSSSMNSKSTGNAPSASTKFLALALFCWFTVNNGFSWLLFNSVATDLRATFPQLSTNSVYLLSSWQPLMYLLAFYPLTRLQSGSSDGLRKAVLVGTTFEFMGAGLKLAATFIYQHPASVILLHIGQMLSAIASPVAIGAPTSLSALWFDSRFRTRTTGTAVLSNNIGNALAFAVVPTLSLHFGFHYCIYLEVASATLLEVIALCWFPSAPLARRRRVGGGNKRFASIRGKKLFSRKGKKANHDSSNDGAASPDPGPTTNGRDEEAVSPTPSASVSMCPDEVDMIDANGGGLGAGAGSGGSGFTGSGPGSVGAQVKQLFSVKSTAVLCIAYAWSSGSYVAWTSLYDALMGGSVQLDAVYIGFVSLAAMLSYVVGGAVSSFLTDLYLRHRMKAVIAASMTLCAISAAIFMVLAKSAQSDCTNSSSHRAVDSEINTSGQPLPLVKSCRSATSTMKMLILVAGALTGAFTGAAAPIFYELIAEISYPVPEVISGNVLSLAENVGALLVYQGAQFLRVGQVNLAFMIGMALGVVLVMFLVTEVHLRPIKGKLKSSGKRRLNKRNKMISLSQEDEDAVGQPTNIATPTSGASGLPRRGEALATDEEEDDGHGAEYSDEEEEEDYDDDDYYSEEGDGTRGGENGVEEEEEMDELERHNQPMHPNPFTAA